MALFQKNPHTTTEHQPFYSLGQEKTILVVGLGNKGKKYEKTRHNIGFVSVDMFAEAHEFPVWMEKKDLKCLMTAKPLGGIRVILCKPTTMMNLSGEAVRAIMSFYKIPIENVVVVHDELAIPFGQIRVRTGGSDAGNNGVKSVIQVCGADFHRIRIGIQATTKLEASDFVLSKFDKVELEQVRSLTREVISILTEYIYSGHLPPETRKFIT
jgi:PTH1 family peptidyl-tRNA hydrolase